VFYSFIETDDSLFLSYYSINPAAKQPFTVIFHTDKKVFAFFREMFYTVCMKKYPFLFSKLTVIVLILGLLLCGAGIGMSVFRIVADSAATALDIVGFSIMIAICVVLAVLILMMIFRSRYLLGKGILKLQLGFIFNKCQISSIESVHLFRGARKLVLYFKDGRNSVVAIKESYFDDFVQTLLDMDGSIGFSFSTAEEEDEIKKKK